MSPSQKKNIPSLFAIVDANDFEAIPFEPISPLHKAIIDEIGPDKSSTYEVNLKDSMYYENKKITAIQLDKPRPLLQVSARCGFGPLPLSFIKLVGIYVNAGPLGPTLVTALVVVCKKIIPADEYSIELMDEILTIKGICFEEDEDIETLCELEEVLDCYDKEDRRTLEAEIKAGKTKKATKSSYSADLVKWKVLLWI